MMDDFLEIYRDRFKKIERERCGGCVGRGWNYRHMGGWLKDDCRVCGGSGKTRVW
jgi:hypothetical protein